MSKVITFSRFFQKNHPKAGLPTYFVEGIWKELGFSVEEDSFYPALNGFDIKSKNKMEVYYPICDMLYYTSRLHSIPCKKHTIRAGHRFEKGEFFSPRVWSKNLYNSPQIIIAPDIEVKQVFDFEMDENGIYSVNGSYLLKPNEIKLLAQNDGLTADDLFDWFMPNYNKPKPFEGQIICWSDSVKY